MSEITPEVKSVLEKVEKLLRLAASNPNEAEAASATAKAQDLLAAYNLDMAALEENTGDGKREKEELDGGRYEWQRDLWGAVADLNFCFYLNRTVFIESPLGTTKEYRSHTNEDGVERWRYVRGMWRHQHHVIGRKVNVAATKAMSTYLESVCDRIVKERVRNTNERANGRWANSFRDGLVARVLGKIYDRRADILNEEQLKRKAQMDAAAASAAAGASTSTALTLASYAKSEDDANIDFVYGEGTSARWAANRAAEAAAQRAAEEEYTRWAAANPEKARKQEEERKRKAERDRQRQNRSYFKNKNTGAWLDGHRAGESVSIDQQAEQRKAKGLLR